MCYSWEGLYKRRYNRKCKINVKLKYVDYLKRIKSCQIKFKYILTRFDFFVSMIHGANKQVITCKVVAAYELMKLRMYVLFLKVWRSCHSENTAGDYLFNWLKTQFKRLKLVCFTLESLWTVELIIQISFLIMITFHTVYIKCSFPYLFILL